MRPTNVSTGNCSWFIFCGIDASGTPLHDLEPSSFPKRQLDTHRRSLSRLAFPFHLGADFPRSFADADAAEVAGLAVGLGGGVEALAVIGDAKG